MTLQDLENALLTVGPPVFHFTALQAEAPYIVYAEDGQASKLPGDDMALAQTLSGTVDYFTRQENDRNVQAIQTALNEAGIPWDLSSIQYEDDTRLIHYEWVVEVLGWHA